MLVSFKLKDFLGKSQFTCAYSLLVLAEVAVGHNRSVSISPESQLVNAVKSTGFRILAIKYPT
jgi:hypothetical protein